jgi:prepilin-type N-terminal cleavage/methylation domain-containing protein
MIHRRPASAPAFTLMEMIVVVMLLAVFLLIFSQLFIVTFRAKSEAEKRDALLHRVDSAIAVMRGDVWATRSMHADGPQVDLLSADGAPITWRSASDGTLSRSDGDAPARQWKHMPAITFASEQALLTLHIHTPGADETLTLISQQMLQGGTP